MLLADAMEEFLLDGRSAGWSGRTVETYRWHVARWLTWLGEHQVTAAADLTKLVLRQWGASLVDDWAPATRKGAITAARACVRWLIAEGEVDESLLRALKVPRVPEQVQRTLSAREIQKLLLTCETPAKFGVTEGVARLVCVRNAALVALLYDSLIRAEELCSVELTDLDVNRGTVTVRRGKGGGGRVAPFGPDTALLLRAWLVLRPAGDAHLFVSLGGNKPGEALTPRGLRIILKRLGERAGVKDVSPHAFRRGGTVACVLNGAPSRLLMSWAGWCDAKMIDVYTRALDVGSDALNAYKAYSPMSTVKKATVSAR